MICSEFFELLDNYESITDEQRIEMEKHTAECETCRKELEFFKSIISNLESIPSPKAPETLIEKVNAKLDAEKTAVIGFRWNFRVLSTVAACLAIGLAVGINNGYIKETITDRGTDGVISETVVSTPEEADVPVNEVASETEAPFSEPAKVEKTDAKTVVLKTTKTQNTNDAVTTTTKAPVKTEPPKPDKVETPPVQTAAPAPTPDNVQNVEDYQIKDDEPQIAYGHYNIERTRRTPSAISDYLHVQSDDMGAVVSTMSEMGFRYSGGYYMTSRQNFYEFINRLDDESVGYSCDLRYSSGDNISFRLTYN